MSRGISQHSILSLTDIFACPACHGGLENEPGRSGSFLLCHACGTAVPVADGFALFTEAGPLTKREAAPSIMGEPGAYTRFVEQAWRRPAFEPYAAFAPFNEATRALYPLI